MQRCLHFVMLLPGVECDRRVYDYTLATYRRRLLSGVSERNGRANKKCANRQVGDKTDSRNSASGGDSSMQAMQSAITVERHYA